MKRNHIAALICWRILKCGVFFSHSVWIANMSRPSQKSSAAWEYRKWNACTLCISHTRHMLYSSLEKKQHNKTWHFLLSAITLNKWLFAFCARICIWWTALCSQKWHQLNGCQMFKNKWNIALKWEWSYVAMKTISECKCKWWDALQRKKIKSMERKKGQRKKS